MYNKLIHDNPNATKLQLVFETANKIAIFFMDFVLPKIAGVLLLKQCMCPY